MAKIKKPIPLFKSEKEEAEYWDRHSPMEHFEESDFKPLQVKSVKDRPITIRLNSEARQRLAEMAGIYKVGPSTLARAIITAALERWKNNQQISMSLEDAAEILAKSLPNELKSDITNMFEEGKTGNFYFLSESKLKKMGEEFTRHLIESSGIKVKPEDKAFKDIIEKLPSSYP
jgi:hypothetical protein